MSFSVTHLGGSMEQPGDVLTVPALLLEDLDDASAELRMGFASAQTEHASGRNS